MNAKTTSESPKLTNLGTVKEVALLAETMTAKFQTSLSRKFRLLHLSTESAATKDFSSQNCRLIFE